MFWKGEVVWWLFPHKREPLEVTLAHSKLLVRISPAPYPGRYV